MTLCVEDVKLRMRSMSDEANKTRSNSVVSTDPSIKLVQFTVVDWERTKGKIASYNKQLIKQREKNILSGKIPWSLETSFIKYREMQ